MLLVNCIDTVPQTDHGLEATDVTGNTHIHPVTVQASPLVGKRDLAMKIADEHTKCEEHVVYSLFVLMYSQV